MSNSVVQNSAVKPSISSAVTSADRIYAAKLQHIASQVLHKRASNAVISVPAMLVQVCCRSYMLWSVNTGGWYPYPNGTDIAKYVSSSDFKLLDTNGDGSITQADDHTDHITL